MTVNEIKMNKVMLLHMIDFVKADKSKDFGAEVSRILMDEFTNRVDQYIINEIPKYNSFTVNSGLEIEKSYILIISKILDIICSKIQNYLDTEDEEYIDFLNKYNENEDYLSKFLCTHFN